MRLGEMIRKTCTTTAGERELLRLHRGFERRDSSFNNYVERNGWYRCDNEEMEHLRDQTRARAQETYDEVRARPITYRTVFRSVKDRIADQNERFRHELLYGGRQ